MADTVQTLIEMGFPKERAEYAVNVTNKQGVEAAMEWLLAHSDEAIPTPAPEAASSSATSSEAAAVAKSLKCDECGKVLKDQSEAEYHAAKTGHAQFSESTDEKKPLTEEERKEQLALIEERLRLKRAEREEREKLEDLEREKNRIKSGKGMAEARRRIEEEEMKKLIDQRKREKAEDKAARERVRAQIEADRKARKEKEALERNGTSGSAGQTVSPVPVTSSTTESTSPATKATPKEYTHARIQVRLLDGSTLVETFTVKEQLAAVRLFIQMKGKLDAPFGLVTSFPRKVFTADDYEQTLEQLGLSPSAVLIVTKSAA